MQRLGLQVVPTGSGGTGNVGLAGGTCPLNTLQDSSSLSLLLLCSGVNKFTSPHFSHDMQPCHVVKARDYDAMDLLFQICEPE